MVLAGGEQSDRGFYVLAFSTKTEFLQQGPVDGVLKFEIDEIGDCGGEQSGVSSPGDGHFAIFLFEYFTQVYLICYPGNCSRVTAIRYHDDAGAFRESNKAIVDFIIQHLPVEEAPGLVVGFNIQSGLFEIGDLSSMTGVRQQQYLARVHLTGVISQNIFHGIYGSFAIMQFACLIA